MVVVLRLAAIGVVCGSVMDDMYIRSLHSVIVGIVTGNANSALVATGVRLLPRIALAVVLWCGARWLSRLIVRVPNAECPSCAYAVLPTMQTCPECGLVLRPGDMTQQPAIHASDR